MFQVQFGEFVQIDLGQFLNKSNQLRCEVKGTMASISGHKKYIIVIMLGKKEVMRTYKRFTQFESLYELLKHKFPSLSIGEFPSRLQIFGKEETRKQFFSNLLNHIIQDASKITNAKSQDMMKIVFNFLTDHILQEKARKTLMAKKNKQTTTNKQNLAYQVETDAKSESGSRVAKISHQQQGDDQYEVSQRRTMTSADRSRYSGKIMRVGSSSSGASGQIIVDKAPQIQENVYDNQFEIKFANEDGWKSGFIEVKDSTMYLFKTKLDNHFKTCIELYRINVNYYSQDIGVLDRICQRLELSSAKAVTQNRDILCLYHDYDKKKMLIRKPCPENITTDIDRFNVQNLRDQLIKGSHKQPKAEHFQGVFNPIGKIFIFLHRINCHLAQQETQKVKIWVRIKTEAFVYHTTPVKSGQEAEINQGFLIPISNIFEKISIECYTGKKQLQTGGEVVGAFKFSMVEFFIKFQRSLIKKLSVKLQGGEKRQEMDAKLQVSLQNLSDLSSVYSSSYLSERDGVKRRQISDLIELDDFTLSINRVQYMIGNISLFFGAFRRNIAKFKYPILGYTFFTWLMINVAFIPLTHFLRQILAIIIVAILYQQQHVHVIISYLFDQYIFSYLHPSFRVPQVLSTDDITDLKWAHQMQQIAEDYQFKQGKLEKKNTNPRTIYKLTVHAQDFVITEEQPSFFEKIQAVGNTVDAIYQIINTLAFTLQKIANLFSWVDFRKTLFICLAILICAGFNSSSLIQLTICVICGAKLIIGTTYYQSKHYEWNRRFAVYSLRYILLKFFPHIIGHSHIHWDMSYVELSYYLSDLDFPMGDQSEQKKLREQMRRIMGVYLQSEPIMKITKQNKLKLVHLIDMIETCQKKLILNFIPGEQGLTNQFQQLKQETKEIQDLDDWFREAAMNFVLNIPSKLFMIFHRNQLHKIANAEAKQNNCEQINTLPSSRKSVHNTIDPETKLSEAGQTLKQEIFDNSI